jgi:D,D-heptose 1,7-bisphosphate phosphatase
MNRAIFLDRDGTLNPDPGYISAPEKFELFPGTVEALKSLADAGFKLVLITNQSGIARGLITPQQLEAIHEKLRRLLYEGGVELTAIYCCPHHPDFPEDDGKTGCLCRKPAPGLVRLAIEQHNIDTQHSFVIGDRDSDLQLAVNAGITPVFIGEELPKGYEQVVNFSSLKDAADWILAAEKFSMFD